MEFNISDVPFSRYGSYLVFSTDLESGELLLRDVHGGDESESTIFKIEVIKNGNPVPYSIKVSETKLTLMGAENPQDEINICISEEDMIHIEARGIGLRFNAVKTRYDNVLQYDLDKWEYHFYSKEIKMMFSLIEGNVALNAPWKIVGNESIAMDVETKEDYMHLVIESYKTVWKCKNFESYEMAQKKVDECYGDWIKSMPEVLERYKASRELASYITWSCVVHPQDKLTRYAMYMSKNSMNNIWSWDNCFNAMMLSLNHPGLALDQLLLFVDNQDECGIYPDFINDRYSSFSCCKPPIHAWAFSKIRKNNNFFNTRDVVETMYESLSRATEYWLVYRRKNKNTLPLYNHGNDSGWDNASVFHMGIPVESPDLAAHLIRQMDILSEMADELGKMEDKDRWRKEADDMYELLMKRLWSGNGFSAIVHAAQEREIPYRTSLLLRLPIVIGYRFPTEITASIVTSLKDDFESTFGLATESYKSPLYKEDGYWLGPVWAPVMYLIIDALNSLGYSSIAKDYAQRFCNATITGGMAENFDPFTGKGLVDPAFTWTSSVFLMLAKEYL
ncbi:hypothetical protein G9F72_005765 [Clostridium estertheticum]|uniref:amylo-alpha-1,6-glucosidase n=1 Tax=Clostridium estertheticum TaxID=238834 RepID=UPI00192245D2|nr:trehalase family glycosidase [Clostridium estertheticum]MBZ9685848.1 hypothetical protein [Clostridium estertheticum]